MSRKLALRLAAALALGIGQAQAADMTTYPRWVGTGESATIDYGPGPHNNVVGGGVVRAIGGGENLQLVHEGPAQTQEPMYAHAVGGGENLEIHYSRVPDRALALAELAQTRSGVRR
jgi:hypothetical protein